MKKLLAIMASLFASAASLFAVESVELKIKGLDGKERVETRHLEEIEKGVRRLQIKKEDLAKNIEKISVIADDAIVEKGTKGYFVLSTGCYGDFSAPDGSIYERRNPLPLYGVKKGDKAFVGIVKGLKNEFATLVEAKGGNYKIYLDFLIKEIEFTPYEDLIIDFYNLEGDDANYSGMGRAYRKYQLGRGEVVPLRERVKGNPQLAYTVDTMFVRVNHGTKPVAKKYEHQTLETEPKINVYHTFDSFINIMKGLKELGVDKVEMCTVGWNAGGFDGRFPDLFPVPEEFGGEKKMREAINMAHKLGYQIVCHVCNTDFYKIATRWSDGAISKMQDGKLRPYAHMAGGRAYNPCFKAVRDDYVPEDYKRLAELGLKGTHHIDVTSCIVPYTCHDPKHPCNRQQTADAQNDIGMLARKVFGGFGSEGPFDHVAKSLDYALYVWAYPRWAGRANPLVNGVVPIWQIAYHGIILSNPFYATIDYNFDEPRWGSPFDFMMNPKERRLKLYEFGGRPTYYFTSYKNLKPIKEAYDEYQNAKYLQYEFMDDHREIAPKVFLTTYSDGSRVVTNYNNADFNYQGRKVGAMDYIIIKPGLIDVISSWF